MKKIKRLIIPLFIVLSILVINSCNNDEAIIIPSTAAGNSNDSNSENTNNQEQGNDGEITLYKIDNDNISKIKDYKVSGEDLEYQKDVAKHNQIWDLVKKIVPLSQRKKMGEFLIYNGTTSGSAGFVVQLKKDLSSWKMGIAINYAFQGSFNAGGELAYTIIHEFGHVLTLNDTQLNASITTEKCKSYFPGEGCAKENSYINELHGKYWKDIWTEYEVAKKDQESQQKFYNKHKNRFVTQYASTNPPEDIAEVFATFITKKDKPAGNTIAEEKILLMYQRNELIEFRNHIRKNLQLRGRGNSFAFELPEPGKWKQANTFGNPYKTKCRHR